MVDPAETKLKLLAALDANDKVVVLDIVADLGRQIAELRDHCNAMEVEHRQAIEEMQSALAENARLRALPLKDEVERVLELAREDIGGDRDANR